VPASSAFALRRNEADIAKRREAESAHERIPRLIDKGVERTFVERRVANKADRRTLFIRILPFVAPHGHGRVFVARAHGERRLGLVESRGRISEASPFRGALSTTNSSMEGPMIGDPSGFLATGTWMVKRPPPFGAEMSQPASSIV